MKDYNVSKETIAENIIEAARMNGQEIANILNASNSIENDLAFLKECLKAIGDNNAITNAYVCKESDDVIEVEIEHEILPFGATWTTYSDTIYDLVKAKVRKEEVKAAFEAFKNPSYQGEAEDSVIDVIHTITQSI
jgi:biotin synthase-related radical SAM superfamily protein